MLMRLNLILAAALVLAFAWLNPVSAEPCATWKAAEKALRSAWAKGYPNEKIIKIEQNGEPTSYDKLKATGKTKIDEHGEKWEYYKKNTYCQVPAKVLVQQGSGKRVFNVSAIFRKAGSTFVFDDMGVGESYAMAEQGQEPPTKDEIKKLITDLWLEKNPGSKVTKVAISNPELKKDSSKGRWWYNTGADIYTVDASGNSKKCSNDYTTVYKGEKGMEGVSPAGPWKVYFLDDPSCP
jgi:hypothetical protein